MPSVPHFNYPFQIRGRKVNTVEQDTVEEVIICVYAVLATELGSRQEEPDFGWPDPAFRQGGADLEEMVSVVDEWEPRADVLSAARWQLLTEYIRTEVGVSTET